MPAFLKNPQFPGFSLNFLQDKTLRFEFTGCVYNADGKQPKNTFVETNVK